jgi:hypothetical protein
MQFKQQGIWPTVGLTPNFIEDVFSTYLYTGTGAAQAINNGIALVANYGGSVKFDGTGDYLTVASNAAFGYGTGDFTIECWINPSIAHNGYVIDHGTAGNIGTIELGGTGGITYYRPSTAIQTGTGVIAVGSWTHVAVVRSSGTTTIYINGVNSASGADSYNYPTQRVVIGAISLDFLYSFNGYISNLRIVKGTAVYTANFTPSTTPLTAISGTSLLTGQAPSPLIDNSANAFTITVVNAVADTSYGPFADAATSKGGLVWIKYRQGTFGNGHYLYDTVRGAGKVLFSNTTDAESAADSRFTSFNSNGFSLSTAGGSAINASTYPYVSWTFREQAKFFDIVTYTGNGVNNRAIPHNLGSAPGCMIVKSTATAGPWIVYHRSLPTQNILYLNLNVEIGTPLPYFPTNPDANNFYVGGNGYSVNDSGEAYVAYLFAHDAGGFGLTGTDNVISCGSFTGAGAGVARTVTLGYEPQFLLVKRTDATQNWYIFDNMRGLVNGTGDAYLSPNLTAAEVTGQPSSGWFTPTATGFIYGPDNFMGDTANIIYVAIRRGPMKVPTLGTSVFSTNVRTGTGSAASITGIGFPPDVIFNKTTAAAEDWNLFDKLRGRNKFLYPSYPTGESPSSSATQDLVSLDQDGFSVGTAAYSQINYTSRAGVNEIMRRAPSFLDVVCYTGTGSNTTFAHNLGAVPQLMIVKSRTASNNWDTYCSALANTQYLVLNDTAAAATGATRWNSTTPTSSVFSVGTSTTTNASADTFVAHLFATCAGVSKVGSYTGTGALQTVACGFTSGSRFVMIKRTDSTGDWYVWDSVRGITSGNDPYVLMNTSGVEVTGTNYVDTDTTGFKVTAAAPAGLNANGGNYIFLAIA